MASFSESLTLQSIVIVLPVKQDKISCFVLLLTRSALQSVSNKLVFLKHVVLTAYPCLEIVLMKRLLRTV